MINETGLFLLLVIYVLPLVFIVWAIVAVVNALKRIAVALERAFPEEGKISGQRASTKSEDPAYKYLPKQ